MPASERGSSFYKAYMKCPKYFDFRYNKNVLPKGISLPLLLGDSFHEGMKRHYINKKKKVDDFDAVVLAAMDVIENSKVDNKSKHIDYITRMLVDYEHKYRKIDEDWEVVGTEFPSVVMIGGILYTGRMDLLVRQISTGLYYVVDHKTTGKALDAYFREFQDDIQGTGYTYIGSRISSVPISGIIINAVQKHKDKAESFTFGRDTFLKTPKDYAEFESTIKTLDGLIQIADVDNSLYYKNRTSCWSFGKPCEYLKLCNYGETEDILYAFYERGQSDVR